MGFRRWRTKCLFSLAVFTLFTSLWIFMTLLIIAASEQQQLEYYKNQNSITTEDTYMGRGIQVVVGHFNGKMPEVKLANLSKETINANNFNPVSGAGENGHAIRLNMTEEMLGKDLFQINQFNIIASDKIPLDRKLPDVRKKACKDAQYPDDLPDTSVIIVFHNEAWSSLLRTVTSVITKSPKKLLKEIVLVDDDSDREFLKRPLDEYVKSLPVSVKVIHSEKRVGLIRARLIGAKRAKGKVLTFLDSHCECTEGWLQPLLARIYEDRTAVVCPIIDVINDQTFAYQRGIELFRGGFNWNLQFRWYSVSTAELKRRGQNGAATIRSPTMAGGLFAMEKNYFYEIGSYDNQMDIWGGENLEMSFRIWQCGGKVEIHPCSHVGHVFRKASPHDFPDKGSGTILNSNLVRVAEVWMDDYKHIFYGTAPQALTLSKDIDVTERRKLRKELKCKDFGWYLDNVWPEHFLPRNERNFGRVRNADGDSCLEIAYVYSMSSASGTEKRISLGNCQLGNFTRLQFWVYTKEGRLKADEHQCLQGAQVAETWIVQAKECGDTEKEIWDYKEYSKQILHRDSQLCLDRPWKKAGADETNVPSLRKCSRDSSGQVWNFLPVKWNPQK